MFNFTTEGIRILFTSNKLDIYLKCKGTLVLSKSGKKKKKKKKKKKAKQTQKYLFTTTNWIISSLGKIKRG
jgi:hypothetical protein